MKGIESTHRIREDGSPGGGTTTGRGFEIAWQDGPVESGPDGIRLNGAIAQDVLKAVIDRIEFVQRTTFASDHMRLALYHLFLALDWIRPRTDDRDDRDIEAPRDESLSKEEGCSLPY